MWLQEPKFQFQSWEKMMKCIMVNRLQECYCQLKICKIFGFAFSISSTWYFQPTRCLCSQKLENVYFRFMQKSSVFILAEQVVVSIKFQSEEFVKKFLFFFWNLEVNYKSKLIQNCKNIIWKDEYLRNSRKYKKFKC